MDTMAIKYSMKQVREARSLILYGYSVKEVSAITKMSEGSVRNYTKSERAKVKAEQLA